MHSQRRSHLPSMHALLQLAEKDSCKAYGYDNTRTEKPSVQLFIRRDVPYTLLMIKRHSWKCCHQQEDGNEWRVPTHANRSLTSLHRLFISTDSKHQFVLETSFFFTVEVVKSSHLILKFSCIWCFRINQMEYYSTTPTIRSTCHCTHLLSHQIM